VKTKRVVITGGAGFLGSHLCDRFLAEGWDVVAVDNFVTGHERNLAHLNDNPRFSLVRADISAGFDVGGPVGAVLNFASPASPIDYAQLPIETLMVGSMGVKYALDLALRKGARFLQASTSEIYGDPLEHPQAETYWGNVSTLGPRSCYDEAKRFGEAMTVAYRRVHGADTRLIRIFNTYGPRMRLDDGRVVPAFLGQAMRKEPITVFGDGSQTRSFCYVSDLVEGIWRVLNGADPGPYNLGNPCEFTMLEFAQAVQRLFGATVIRFEPLPAHDPRKRQPDITKARTELGWEPAVPFEEGLGLTWAYFKRAGSVVGIDRG